MIACRYNRRSDDEVARRLRRTASLDLSRCHRGLNADPKAREEALADSAVAPIAAAADLTGGAIGPRPRLARGLIAQSVPARGHDASGDRPVILRCTTRMLGVLGKNLALADVPPGEDDWYANVLWIERRKCLLLTHTGTLYPVFAPEVRAGDVRPPGPLVTTLVRDALEQEGLPADAVGQLDPADVRIARTASRQILGFMNETAQTIRFAVERAGGLENLDLDELGRFLRRNLHNRDGYHHPLELVAARLRSAQR